jgi:hypothetical protein
MARRTTSLFRHPVTKQLLPLSEIKKTMTKKEFRAFKKQEGIDFWTQVYRIFIGDKKDSGYDSMYGDPRL